MSIFLFSYYIILIIIVIVGTIFNVEFFKTYWPQTAFMIFIGPVLEYCYLKIQSARFFTRAKEFHSDFKGSRYFVRPALNSEIDTLYNDFIKLFGPDLLNLNELKKIHAKNENTILLVCKELVVPGKDDKSVTIGFFELFPMMQRYKSHLLNNNLDGRILSQNRILGQTVYAKNYYLGSIGILPSVFYRENFYKGVVLKEFLDHLYQINKHYSFTLFTRPVTQDGLRLVSKYGFKKTDPGCKEGDCIWFLIVSKGSFKIDENGKIKFGR